MKKAELLAPAGNLEKLKIALAYGADAVYGGTSTFSLRIRSGKEFDMESYREGIEYAHSLGKKVYTTINSFPFNSQLKLYRRHISQMAELKPDAVHCIECRGCEDGEGISSKYSCAPLNPSQCNEYFGRSGLLRYGGGANYCGSGDIFGRL